MFSFLEFRVRLTGEYAKHSGIVGAFEFKDGVTVRKLHRREAEMLAAIGMHGIAIDDDGQDVFELKVGQIPAPDSSVEELRAKMPKLKKSTDEDAAPSSAEAPEEAEYAVRQPDERPEYTREQLEAIADKAGLRGLRDIADGYGIKGKSIAELIEKILKG